MEKRMFRGSLKSQVVFILFGGILAAVLINLTGLIHWPLVLVVGIAGMVLFCYVTKTVVWVTDKEIEISRFGKKTAISMTASFRFEQKTKIHLIEIVKYTQVTGVLHVMNPDQGHLTFSLGGFSEKEIDRLKAEIYARQLAAVPREEKIKIVEESWREEMILKLPKYEMISREWNRVCKSVFLLLGLGAVMCLLTFTDTGAWDMFKLIFLVLAVVMTLLFMPVEIIRVWRHKKNCPEVIRYVGDHLMVDSKHFALSGIAKVSVTAADLTSQTMFPVQRYLVITCVDGSFTYWLGTEGENGYCYSALCNLLKLAFILYPEKLVFNRKASILTK